jgi:hypothetical protein
MATSFPSFNLYNTQQSFAPYQASSAQDTASQDTQSAQTTQSASSQDDTVQLSEKAKAKLLYQQGASVSNIASELGTSAKEINSDLNLTDATEKILEETASTATA